MSRTGRATYVGRRRSRSPLEQLDRALEETAGAILRPRHARDRAYERAQAALHEAGGGESAAAVAMLGFATEVIGAYATKLAHRQPELRQLIERIDADLAIPRSALARGVLGLPQLLQLPSAVAIDVQLGLLLAFIEGRAVSIWALTPDGTLEHVAHAGAFDPEVDRSRLLARKLLGGQDGWSELLRDLAGIRFTRRGQPAAALIAQVRDASTSSQEPMLESATPILTAMLERDELVTRGAESDDTGAAAERRLARLRFDLHDGPQQDIALLGEDIRLLRSQLEAAMDGQPSKPQALGRIDDLQAQLVAIDGDLRRISSFVQSPFLQAEALPEALTKLAGEFAARTGIEPQMQFKGDFMRLTDSQQITLLGLIRESLSNIREHSDAKTVTIALCSGSAGLEVTVTDDGRGFDPETKLVEAAREGHLGLVGMHERVRMLGGRTKIESRPGGPTVISVSLPPWSPPATTEAAG